MDDLSKIKKKQIFKVPDNYFNEFSSRLQDKIHKEKPVSGVEKIMLFARPKLTLAFLIVGFILIAYVSFKLFLSDNLKTELSANDIAEIIEYNAYDFDENLFIEALEETDFEIIEDAEYTNEIIDYLIEENIDYLTLINEL